MTGPMGMDELIARLEKLNGPDRELDGLIAVAVFKPITTDDDLFYARKRDPGEDATHPGHYFIKSRSGAQAVSALHYTESIDAAIPGEDIIGAAEQHGGGWRAIHRMPEGQMTVSGRGNTEALARRIAALRALASTQGE